MDNEEGATAAVDDGTYCLQELIYIHSQLVKSDRPKMLEARDKLEEIISAMINEMTYE